MTSCIPSCWGDCRCRSAANENTTNTTENRPSRTGSCKNCEAKSRRSGLGCRKRNDETRTSKRNSGENQEIVGGCWSGGHGCFITSMHPPKPKTACSICEQKKKSRITAETFCPECEEALCKTCAEHHKLSKISKSHHTIPVQHYSEIPTFVLKTEQCCLDHKLEYEMYCQDHKHPCCVRCVAENHVDCHSLKPLNDVVHNAKSSELLGDIEKSIDDISAYLETAQKEREEYVRKFEDQIAQCRKHKNLIHSLITDHLNQLDQKMEAELNTRETDYKSGSEKTIGEIEKRRENVKKIADDISAMRKYASDRQTFLAMHLLNESVSKEQNAVYELSNNMEHIELTVNEPDITAVLEAQSLGALKVVSLPVESVFKIKKKMQAKMAPKQDNSRDKRRAQQNSTEK